MPKPAESAVTDAEIDSALLRARQFEKYDRKAVKVTYSKATDSLRIALSDGATYTVPRTLIQGIATAEEKDLRHVQILNGGSGILWPTLKVAHYVPGLLQGVYGSEKWMTKLFKRRPNLVLLKRRRTPKHKSKANNAPQSA